MKHQRVVLTVKPHHVVARFIHPVTEVQDARPHGALQLRREQAGALCAPGPQDMRKINEVKITAVAPAVYKAHLRGNEALRLVRLPPVASSATARLVFCSPKRARNSSACRLRPATVSAAWGSRAEACVSTVMGRVMAIPSTTAVACSRRNPNGNSAQSPRDAVSARGQNPLCA